MEYDPYKFGLDNAYSGAGDVVPRWVGPKLAEFDECDNFSLSFFAPYMTVTDQMKAKWRKCLDKMNPELYKVLLELYGESPENPDGSGGLVLKPELMVIWSTS